MWQLPRPKSHNFVEWAERHAEDLRRCARIGWSPLLRFPDGQAAGGQEPPRSWVCQCYSAIVMHCLTLAMLN
jgi:hypothetical protein